VNAPDLPRRLVAEALGTALLLADSFGSGIMGERLAGGNEALALLANTLATGAGLVVLIWVFGPISGAHFNPAVSLVWRCGASWRGGTRAPTWLRRYSAPSRACGRAHAMFAAPILEVSTKLRDGPSQVFSRRWPPSVWC
jgi:glycerol uptake facilitator-like aquaporin